MHPQTDYIRRYRAEKRRRGECTYGGCKAPASDGRDECLLHRQQGRQRTRKHYILNVQIQFLRDKLKRIQEEVKTL